MPALRRCAAFTRRTSPRFLISCRVRCFVTTYQAGKLVILRSDGGVINTHFRAFNKPMGMAIAPGRLAIGTAVDVWEFRNVPAVAAKLDPPGKHDACYLPRSAHVTGDIQIHEMAYVGNDVLFVNTRFSCLATHDPDHSFAPVWRPKFISQLTPDDRCHLNGLCVVDGRPKWVTALGETDTGGGWRENKKSGGILIDIDSQRNRRPRSVDAPFAALACAADCGCSNRAPAALALSI